MGSGKTLLLAATALRARKAGRLVFANFTLAGGIEFGEFQERYPYVRVRGSTGRVTSEYLGDVPKGMFVRIRNWDQALDVPDNSLVLLAELQLWWPSSVAFAPEGVMAWVHQIRHHGITALWDSQHYTFVSTRIRKLTYGVWVARPYYGGHEYTLYEGAAFNERKPDPKLRLARMKVKRKADVKAVYDTKEDVESNLAWSEKVAQNRRTVFHESG